MAEVDRKQVIAGVITSKTVAWIVTNAGGQVVRLSFAASPRP
jgi:hypothetical protein